jgi:flavodoxin
VGKAIVVYDTKYGNTRKVAEKIVEGLAQMNWPNATIRDVEETTPADILDYDLILLGAPNHLGRPARTMSRFIDAASDLDLHGKPIAVFDTYMGGDFEKAMKKMKERIGSKIPVARILSPGLSIRVEKTKGPIADGEIQKCVEFGVRIGSLLKSP